MDRVFHCILLKRQRAISSILADIYLLISIIKTDYQGLYHITVYGCWIYASEYDVFYITSRNGETSKHISLVVQHLMATGCHESTCYIL